MNVYYEATRCVFFVFFVFFRRTMVGMKGAA
jgi:hypothetical protein